MAGTQLYVESLVGLVAQTALIVDSNEKNSLEGIDVSGLVDGAICYVREYAATYRYFDALATPAAPPFVIAPSSGVGRWLMIAQDIAVQTSAYVAAGFEDLTGATTEALGAAGAWVDVVTPAWGSNLEAFNVPANGQWEYTGAVPTLFKISAKVSLELNAGLSVSIGIGVGTPDPYPQTVELVADQTLQLETERIESLQSIATGGVAATVQLRSNGAGNETPSVISAQMMISPL